GRIEEVWRRLPGMRPFRLHLPGRREAMNRFLLSLKKGRKAAKSGDKSPHSKLTVCASGPVYIFLALFIVPSMAAAVQAKELSPPDVVAVHAGFADRYK